MLDPETGTTRRARHDELDGDRTWQTGACFLATIAMWDVVGGFDDDYFMYWEDIDLSWRWREAGGALLLRADATAVHDAGGTQSGAGKSSLYVYFNCRNRLLFARKRLASTTAGGGGGAASPTPGASPLEAAGGCWRGIRCCSGPRSEARSRARSALSRARRRYVNALASARNT